MAEENFENGPTKRKVDFSVFVWTISILSGIMLAVSSYLFSEIASIRTALAESSARNEGLVKELTAKLEAERERNINLMVTLTEIRGDVKNIGSRLEMRR